MIVKDEAENLPRCLESVANLVDEMVVVDTGSTDDTPELARSYGARVYFHPWQGDFSQARNVSLEKATGDWILYLDADEILERDSRLRLRQILGTAQADGLTLIQRNLLPPASDPAYKDALCLRLFRNRPEYRFTNPIHEQIAYSIRQSGGEILPTSLVILHYGYLKDLSHAGVSRSQRNLALLEQAVARDPNHSYLLAKLGLTLFTAGQMPRARQYLLQALRQRDTQSRLGKRTTHAVLLCLGRIALAMRDNAAALDYANQSAAYIGAYEDRRETDSLMQQARLFAHPTATMLPSPEERLEQLLAAPDILFALREHRSWLDPELLQLVKSNAHTALTDGDLELAEGLAAFGDEIQQALSASS